MATQPNELRDYWHTLEPVWDVVEISESGTVYLESLKSIPMALGLLHAVHLAQSEICNGGFHQFFSNSSGVLAPESVEGFAAIGLKNASTTVRRAMEPLGSPYTRDRPVRQRLLDGVMGENAFDLLDQEFYTHLESEGGGFQAAANLFAARIARPV